MNRNIPPKFGDIQMPVVPQYVTTTLPNGIPMYVLRGGSQPVVKVDLLFRAGLRRSRLPLVGRATSVLMAEGTVNHTSKELAQMIDFYGAYTWSNVVANYSTISAMCLSRDVKPVFSLMEEMIKYPTFPKSEVDLYAAQELQKFDVSILKTSTQASRNLLKLLYVEGDKSARVANREDYMALTPEVIKEFHSLAYNPTGAQIFVCGQPSEADLKAISDAFGVNWEGGEPWKSESPVFNDKPSSVFIDHEGEQTSLRMARRLFNRMHPDFLPLQVANVALGGYFGSRLMQILREDLGLTYGVSSYISAGKQFGIHGIASEIKAGSHNQVIDVIKNEMGRLSTELIPDKELENIRGYMLGDLLRYFESVTASADTLFSLLVDEVPVSRFEEFYNVVRNITPEEIRDAAARWFNPDEYCISCVGRMS